MVIDEFINKNKEAFLDLCKEHQVKSLFAFGSSVTGDFDFEKSDIDLLVEIDETDPIKKVKKFFHFGISWNLFLKGKLICLPIQISEIHF